MIGYEDAVFQISRNPWHKIIKCEHGHISPAGGSKLWACTRSTRSTAARALRRSRYPCTITMHGDDGINAEFDVADYAVFFRIMGAIRR